MICEDDVVLNTASGNSIFVGHGYGFGQCQGKCLSRHDCVGVSWDKRDHYHHCYLKLDYITSKKYSHWYKSAIRSDCKIAIY